ncbi:MAG: sulfotransferase domain-containing protein [Actinomycetota bacterium]|nr:sulfotransferase domain-containing protein [Actinomycetota bacterium]
MSASRDGAYRRKSRTRLRRAYTTGRAWVRSLTPGIEGSLPDVIVIGGQRCGTTSLFRYLAAHPDVVTPRSKELNALSLHYGKGADWYAGHFPAKGPSQRALEASPLYLADPRVPSRAAERVPDALFVALVRNPVERAYSHYLHNLEYDAEELSFVDALAAEDERLHEARRLGLGSRRGIELFRNASYVSRGLYAEQIERWHAHVAPEQLLVVRAEDFFADPAATYDEVLTRAALPPHDGVTFSRTNHWDDDQETQLTPAVRARLEEQFADSNEKIRQLLGWTESWNHQPA